MQYGLCRRIFRRTGLSSDPHFQGKPLKIYNEIYPLLCELINENDIFKLNFIKSIERFGIRYIDFFEDLNIFEHVQFKILNKDDTSIAQEEKLQILRNFQKNDFFHNITISNNANVFIENIKKEGSIIDIDTYKENYEIDNFIKNYKNYIKIAHDINKQEFFENLNSDFIKNLQEG